MTTEPIRNKNDIQAVKNLLLEKGRVRDYALFVAGINTALRISDLLKLKWCDILAESGCFKEHVRLLEQKTGKIANVFLNEKARKAFALFFSSGGKSYKDCASEYVFKSPRKNAPLGRSRVYKMMKGVSREIGLEGNVSCHSLRKTFGYHAWKTGVPPTLIMNVYNHSNFEVTKRYLGITQDDKDGVYRRVNL